MNGEKYSRQILFPPVGLDGQEKLLGSRVVIVGCGALGTAQANALVRAGVGSIRIIDRDFVEESNLQRQLLFDESDAAQSLPKSVAAERKLRAINSDVRVQGVVADVEGHNIEEMVNGFDLILDGTDNFATRYLINDVSIKLGIPWIYGAVVASYAATMTVVPGRSPCLACVFSKSPEGVHETCDTVGVIGPAVTWAASIQATEAMKILLGRFDELHGSLLACDIWKNHFQEIKPQINPDCRVCAAHEFVHLGARTSASTTLCGRDAVQISPAKSRNLNLQSLRERLEPLGEVRSNEYLLRFRVGQNDLTVFSDGRAIIKGTHDPATARSLYAKYVGS
ncbi:MAG: ThiF family adenylyltransferase [Acidobacteria bacterium]|nr:ThiF family adenylyltransferase [Acidobacteriota bacterium]